MGKLKKKIILFFTKVVLNPLFRNKIAARFLFGVKFGPIEPEYFYYDLSSIATVKKLSEYVSKDTRVIDMGTGAFAVIGLALWKSIGCHVLSVDINKDIVSLARENVKRNNAPIQVIESDFFTHVNEDFDIVSWNPPYVHADAGKYLNLADKTRSQWDGGSDGTFAIRPFLDVLSNLNHDHSFKVFLGINAFYVPKYLMLELIQAHDAISIDEISSHFLSFYNVYVLTVGK